jgi:demethylspheroidene O-methyltransferase
MQRLWVLRDRLLTSTAFQSWALRNPFVRPIARRRAAALFDLCAGFVYSQILLACVRLQLFEQLEAGPSPVAVLAARCGLTRERMLTLLHGAAALKLVEWHVYEQKCGLGSHGAALLGNPGLLPMIEHNALLYEDLSDPVGLLKRKGQGSHLKSFWSYADTNDPLAAKDSQVSPYTALMSASQSFIASEVLEAYDLRRHRSLLDVGGGDGSFCLAAANRAPRLAVRCFDLPAVVEHAQMRFGRAGISDRAQGVGGSFLTDPLPLGSDIVSLIRVIHDHDDAAALRILQAARKALPPGGTLLIAEPLAGTYGGKRVAEAYFGFYLLAMGSGKPRSFTELSKLLARAGFVQPRLRATRLPMNVRVVIARVAVDSVN